MKKIKIILAAALMTCLAAAPAPRCLAQGVPEIKALTPYQADMAKQGVFPAEKKGLWGFVDIKGKYLIKPVFTSATAMNEYGVSKVSAGDKWGLVGKNCRYVLEPVYDSIEDFDKHNLARVTQGGRTGLVTANGKIVTPVEYDAIGPFAEDGWSIVEKDGKKGTVNFKGEVRIPVEYSSIETFGEFLFKVVKDGKVGLLEHSGKAIVEPEWDSVTPSCDNFYIVCRNGRYGTLDLYGKSIIPAEYDSITLHSCGKFLVCSKEGRKGIVTLAGTMFREPCYEYLDEGCWNDVILVRQDGKAGAITSDCGFKIVVFFDSLEWPAGSHDYLVSKDAATGKYGAIDLDGKKILDCEFDCPPELTDSPRLFVGAGRYLFADKKGSSTIADADEQLFKECNGDMDAYMASGKVPQCAKKHIPQYDPESSPKDVIVYRTEWSDFLGYRIGGCGLWNKTKGVWKLRPVYENPEGGPIKCGEWSIGTFKDGRATVSYKGKSSVIDENGNLIK